MFRSAFLLLSGNALGSVLLFARNLIVARMISVEDYGIAATFAMSMALVEMASTFGIQQLIVQDKGGHDPRLQAGLHGVNVLRGILSGLAVFLLAGPIASFFGIPELSWTYQLLAILPVLRGFEHLDIYRLNRRMLYFPFVMSNVGPASVSLLLVWPLFMFFSDFQVMLYSILVQGFSRTLVTHVVANRPFHISFDTNHATRALAFGWPLLLNNILLFLIQQGDKVVIARELGMETLAVFAMGMTLTYTPTSITSSSEQQFFLPQLSAVSTDREKFARLSATAIELSFVSSLVLVIGAMLLGPTLVHLLLGEQYQPLANLVVWMSIQQAVRNLKVGCTTVAISQAYTSIAMVSNLGRLAVLPIVWYIAFNEGNLVEIIWISIVGEAIGFLVSFGLVHFRLKLKVGRVLPPLIFTIFFFLAAGIYSETLTLLIWPVCFGLLIGALTTMRDLKSYFVLRFFEKYEQ